MTFSTPQKLIVLWFHSLFFGICRENIGGYLKRENLCNKHRCNNYVYVRRKELSIIKKN